MIRRQKLLSKNHMILVDFSQEILLVGILDQHLEHQLTQDLMSYRGKMSVKRFFKGTDTMMIRVKVPIKKKNKKKI